MDSNKPLQSKITVLFAALFLGATGLHRYMLGYKNWWMMTLTFGGLGIWTIIDFVKIATGKMQMQDGRPLI